MFLPGISGNVDTSVICCVIIFLSPAFSASHAFSFFAPDTSTVGIMLHVSRPRRAAHPVQRGPERHRPKDVPVLERDPRLEMPDRQGILEQRTIGSGGKAFSLACPIHTQTGSDFSAMKSEGFC